MIWRNTNRSSLYFPVLLVGLPRLHHDQYVLLRSRWSLAVPLCKYCITCCQHLPFADACYCRAATATLLLVIQVRIFPVFLYHNYETFIRYGTHFVIQCRIVYGLEGIIIHKKWPFLLWALRLSNPALVSEFDGVDTFNSIHYILYFPHCIYCGESLDILFEGMVLSWMMTTWSFKSSFLTTSTVVMVCIVQWLAFPCASILSCSGAYPDSFPWAPVVIGVCQHIVFSLLS